MMNLNIGLFLDIETVPKYETLAELEVNEKGVYDSFVHRATASKWLEEYKTLDGCYKNRAGLFSEYNKIICVGIGIYTTKDDFNDIKVATFTDDNEELLIKRIHKIIKSYEKYFICGLNIKTFDIPELNRKFLKYGLQIPENMRTFNVKPWEMNCVDVMDIWKGGSYYLPSLREISLSLGLDDPKNILENKSVYELYYIDKDMEKIKTYCCGDVQAVINILKKINGFI